MPSKFTSIEKVIKKLDVLVPQVMIEAEIMDVDKSDVDKLGFKFSGTDWLKYTGPNFGSVFPLTGVYPKRMDLPDMLPEEPARQNGI